MSLSADELKKCLFAVLEMRGQTNHQLIRRLSQEIGAVSRERQSERTALTESNDDVGSREVAEMLGWNVRRVQRYAKQLGGRKVGPALVFHRADVIEHITGRRR